MKICPKCKRQIDRALQVSEIEVYWSESEGLYVADRDGKSHIYEKCLSCGTELQEDRQKEKGRIKREATELEQFGDLEIEWVSVPDVIPYSDTHGLRLLYNGPGKKIISIGFVEGFEWFRSRRKKGQLVRVYLLSADSGKWGDFLSSSEKRLKDLKECVYIVLKKEIAAGRIKKGISVFANG